MPARKKAPVKKGDWSDKQKKYKAFLKDSDRVDKLARQLNIDQGHEASMVFRQHGTPAFKRQQAKVKKTQTAYNNATKKSRASYKKFKSLFPNGKRK